MRKVYLFFKDIFDTYFEKRVSLSSAALAFFLTLSLFPFIICMSELLETIGITNNFISSAGEGILPPQILEVLSDFFGFITENHSDFMIITAIIMFIMSASASFRTIMNAMYDIQGKTRYTGMFRILFSFVFSIAFPIIIYATFAIILSGEWLLDKIGLLEILGRVGVVWHYTRFIFIFLVLYVIIYGIYAVTAPNDGEKIRRYPGTIAAALVLVGVSIVFSWFIGESVRYRLVYGSVASVIVLMIWMYLCSNILLLGNIVNVVVHRRFGR